MAVKVKAMKLSVLLHAMLTPCIAHTYLRTSLSGRVIDLQWNRFPNASILITDTTHEILPDRVCDSVASTKNPEYD
jgi:hypothetical protein